ncbi:MAG: response regulator [Saprospiraceae bacterium]|nr:response regulator [Saprospiraceae bacterium]
MTELNLLKRRIERERLARKQAEAILEAKALELYNANMELRTLNESLEQKVAERTEQLSASEEKYRGIIENMELGLMEVNTEGVIVRAYPRFCKMVGYQEEELVGLNAASVFLPAEFLPVLKRQDSDRAAGKAGVYEIQIMKKNGERIWVLISGTPIYDAEEGFVGSIGIHYDITYQKNLQRDLEEAKNRAEEAEHAQKQFLANMSHEIRTPLNAILGMSHLLYDTQPTKEQREYLDILKNSAEMLRNLISDVLDLSKIRAGKLETQQKEFDIKGLMRSLVKSSQLRLEDRPLSIELDIDPRLENLVVGDDLLLNQILSNLINNAEKFTEKGRITVAAHIKALRKTQFVIAFTISDTGIGIPKEKLNLIFQAFRQVDGDIKRKFGGTGLGLAIVKQLIELQGGKIKVKSRVGKGTTFTFTLPFGLSNRKIEQIETYTPQYQRLNGQGKKLLVVEDNYMNRKYIGSLLEKWGMPFDIAVDGRKGFDMAQQELYDMILMDIQMPEMDGYETTIAIRQSNNPNQNTPILALTASALISQKDKAFKAGFSDYLSKPFRPNQLFEKIEKYCKSISYEEVVDNDDHTEGVKFAYHERLNHELLTELYGDDWGYAADMFETFLTHTPAEWGQLVAAFHAKNWQEVGRLAHKIKPTFGMVGLSDIEKILLTLEQNAKNQPVDDARVTQLFEAVEQELPLIMTIVGADFEKISAQLVMGH